MLLRIEPSRTPKSKYTAYFSDGSSTHFGGMRPNGTPYGDYTIWYATCGKKCADTHRAQYIARHKVMENWSNPKSKGTLSRYILWEKPTIEAAIKYYNALFFGRKTSRKKTK